MSMHACLVLASLPVQVGGQVMNEDVDFVLLDIPQLAHLVLSAAEGQPAGEGLPGAGAPCLLPVYHRLPCHDRVCCRLVGCRPMRGAHGNELMPWSAHG